MKKRIISVIIAVCIILPITVCGADIVKNLKFTDIPSEGELYEAVKYLYNFEVVNGKSETEFCPEDNLKREEFAKMVSLGFKLEKAENVSLFDDVEDGTWYAEHIQRAINCEMIKGIGDNKFGVGFELSRQDLAVILHRYLLNKGYIFDNDKAVSYADSYEVSDYAKEAIDSFCGADIMTVDEDKLVRPYDNASRADAAIMIYRTLLFEREKEGEKGRMGTVTQYDPPYIIPDDDKIARLMPEIFDAEKFPTQELFRVDYENGELPDNVNISDFSEGGEIITSEGVGANGSNGCIKMVSNENSVMAQVEFKAENLYPGEYLVIEADVRTENFTQTSKGGYYPLLQIYDDNNKWLAETSPVDRKKSPSDEWTRLSLARIVPTEVNATSQPEYYYLRAGVYSSKGTIGTVYVDNVKVSKAAVLPFNTSLVEPKYKGIIYSEDGVSDICVRNYMDDCGGYYNYNDLRLTTTIVDENDKVFVKSATDSVAKETDVFLSSNVLPMGGDYFVHSVVSDKNTGVEIGSTYQTLYKREKDYRPKYYVDKYDRLIKDSEPIFPKMFWNGSEYENFLNVTKGDPLDTYFHFGFGWYYNFGQEKYQKITEELTKNRDMDMTLATGRFAWSDNMENEIKNRCKEQKDLRGLLTKIVNNYKDYEPLMWYYTFDEVDSIAKGKEYQWVKTIISSLDLDHPISGTVDRVNSHRPGSWYQAFDIISTDPYPVTGKEDQDLSMVYKRFEELKKITPNMPIAACLQYFWYDGRKDLRGPTQQEFRNMVFQALCSNVCILNTYSFQSLIKKEPWSGQTTEEIWDKAMEVYSEVEEITPIYLSAEPTPYYKIKNGEEWLNTFARRYNGKSYLFAVNNQNTTNSARIYLDGVDKIHAKYSGKDYTADKDGWFDIEFDVYATEIFEYEQSDYLSSHAKLNSFGLSTDLTGIALLNPDDETSQFIVPKGTEVADYMFNISDFAQAYINGKKVENTGRINLAGINELKIKVVSQDKRFTTEKTFSIEFQL